MRRTGGARPSGNTPFAGCTCCRSRWSRTLLITAGSSIQATILTGPPQALQVSMSKTRFWRCAQVIDARRSAGVCGSSAPMAFLPLPRLAGVTKARCLLFGANTPWKRVRLTLGFGTKAANLAMKSSGSKITWVVSPDRSVQQGDRSLSPPPATRSGNGG